MIKTFYEIKVLRIEKEKSVFRSYFRDIETKEEAKDFNLFFNRNGKQSFSVWKNENVFVWDPKENENE